MTRTPVLLCAILLLFPAAAQEQAPRARPAPEAVPEEPPEEDLSVSESKEYSFNPLQAEKEFKVGGYYSKKGSHKAASLRYREATRWNPGWAEAWLKLAESLEKQGDKKGAREAYARYLELEPDGKPAKEIRRKLAGKS